MANKKYQKFLQMLFARSARNMSFELRTHRAEWEHRKPRRYKRTCEYVMHVQYTELLVELTEVLKQ